MRIDERSFGNVVVLDLKGKMTLGEGDDLLKDKIDTLVQSGRHKRVVLNMKGVPYIDSAGLGEIVRSYTVVSRQGGTLQLMDPTQSFINNLSITKLNTVFEIVSAEELTNGAERWTALCPRCVPETPIALRPDTEYQTCVRCGLSLKLLSWPQRNSGESLVNSNNLVLTTYEHEHVQLAIGRVQEITIHGRLDLFAAEVVEQMWRLIAPPRRVLFTAAQSGITDAGMETIVGLCNASTDDNRAVILITGVTDDSRNRLPRHPAIHTSYQSATHALGMSESTLPPITLRAHLAT